MSKRIYSSLALTAALAVVAGCASPTKYRPPGSPPPTLLDRVGDSIEAGTSKVAAVFTSKPDPNTKVVNASANKPGANVFVAMAQMSENAGDLENAETQLKKALEVDPNHLGAIVAYAHLEDRRNNLEAATKLYQRALKKHPREAAIHNDLGLCYHRRGMLPEAAKSLSRAVELQGERKLYRDNLAAVYVDQGKLKEALAQLTTGARRSGGELQPGLPAGQEERHERRAGTFPQGASRKIRRSRPPNNGSPS